MRILPIFAGACAYWALGALWYSALFAGVWTEGLRIQGVTLAEPSKSQLRLKLLITFLANLGAAGVLSRLCHCTSTESLWAGAGVGAALGLACAAALAVAYTWESKPLRSYAVDASYHFLGMVLAGSILGRWH